MKLLAALALLAVFVINAGACEIGEGDGIGLG